jgi:hypothetical protein
MHLFQNPHKGLPVHRMMQLSNGSITVQRASDYQRPEIDARFALGEVVDLFAPDGLGQHIAGVKTARILSTEVALHHYDRQTETYWWERRYVISVHRKNGNKIVRRKIWESDLLAVNPRILTPSLMHQILGFQPTQPQPAE